jgi:hypothetical protein
MEECRRLNALGVPTRRRYTNGTEATKVAIWRPSRLLYMLHNTLYAGTRVVETKTGGRIERELPALVDRATWGRASASAAAEQVADSDCLSRRSQGGSA